MAVANGSQIPEMRLFSRKFPTKQLHDTNRIGFYPSRLDVADNKWKNSERLEALNATT